ncbi:P-loop NTPase [Pelagibius sp. Alg239-R121]|uniref:P-loop NTPase n=1 Tax=Pelagibius sp. Alg239-R121 TaxID=2993448 RepID=UPI0024A73059|nr:P-loop NTPase [Pelagibius sp. Alg239-R121]
MSTAEDLFASEDAELTPLAECAAFVSDGQTHDVIDAVTRQFYAETVIRDGGSNEAMQYLTEAPLPRVLIVDIGDSSSPLTAMLSLTAAFSEETRLVGIGSMNDINLYREMIGAGISDYLVKPITEKALIGVLQQIEEPDEELEAPAADPDAIQKIVVVGSRGGCGASTVAVNLAWSMAERKQKRTALIDLDLEFGTIALSLDLEPTRGLREALENPSRIDSLFISSATAKLTEKLSVMATEETVNHEMLFDPAATGALFDALGREHDCIVVDLPRSAVGMRQGVFEAATQVVLVTELTLSGLRDSIRVLAGIEEASPNSVVKVIANRTGGAAQAMQLGDFQKALGRKVDFQISEDRKAFNLASNTGKPLVQADSRSKASKTLTRTADVLDNSKSTNTGKNKKSWRDWLKKK